MTSRRVPLIEFSTKCFVKVLCRSDVSEQISTRLRFVPLTGLSTERIDQYFSLFKRIGAHMNLKF